MDIKLSQAFKPALETDKRYRVIFGGAGSGKSYFVGQETLLNMLSGPEYHYLVVRKTGRSIRDSVFRSLTSLISEYDLESYFRINNTEMSIRCVTGSTLITNGLDNVEKLKSISGINRIWVEEASEITEEDFNQLDLRMRGDSSKVGYQMTVTFNPISETHWLKKRFFDVGDEQAFTLKTTYLDNPFLDEQYIQTLNNLKQVDENYYNIYALGEWGSLGKLVYSNWSKEDLTDVMDSFDNLFTGIDFGFSDDPSTIITAHYDSKRDIVYIIDEFKGFGYHIDMLAEQYNKMRTAHYVTCDNAEPRSIAELKRYGVPALAATKGGDSVLHGIQWLQSKKIVVHKDCIETVKELSSYKWKLDKDGNALPKPEDDNDHMLDALRYALESEMVGGGRLKTISKDFLRL